VIDVFGQDIKLDAAGQAMVAANGELLLTEGAETGVQDIRLRLGQPLGELFYDKEFGALIHYWIKEENTAGNRIAFPAEVERRLQRDPRVLTGSVICKIIRWDEQQLTASVQWTFIDDDHPYNLVIAIDRNKQEMVIKDVNP
jgi:hypothetical protein